MTVTAGILHSPLPHTTLSCCGAYTVHCHADFLRYMVVCS